MSAKIAKVMNEIDKTKGKISEFQSKLRELEKQKTELENLQIVDVVRGMDIPFTDLKKSIETMEIAAPILRILSFCMAFSNHYPQPALPLKTTIVMGTPLFIEKAG